MINVIKHQGTPFPIWISLLNANTAWYNLNLMSADSDADKSINDYFVVLITLC